MSTSDEICIHKIKKKECLTCNNGHLLQSDEICKHKIKKKECKFCNSGESLLIDNPTMDYPQNRKLIIPGKNGPDKPQFRYQTKELN